MFDNFVTFCYIKFVGNSSMFSIIELFRLYFGLTEIMPCGIKEKNSTHLLFLMFIKMEATISSFHFII